MYIFFVRVAFEFSRSNPRSRFSRERYRAVRFDSLTKNFERMSENKARNKPRLCQFILFFVFVVVVVDVFSHSRQHRLVVAHFEIVRLFVG